MATPESPDNPESSQVNASGEPASPPAYASTRRSVIEDERGDAFKQVVPDSGLQVAEPEIGIETASQDPGPSTPRFVEYFSQDGMKEMASLHPIASAFGDLKKAIVDFSKGPDFDHIDKKLNDVITGLLKITGGVDKDDCQIAEFMDVMKMLQRELALYSQTRESTLTAPDVYGYGAVQGDNEALNKLKHEKEQSGQTHKTVSKAITLYENFMRHAALSEKLHELYSLFRTEPSQSISRNPSVIAPVTDRPDGPSSPRHHLPDDTPVIHVSDDRQVPHSPDEVGRPVIPNLSIDVQVAIEARDNNLSPLSPNLLTTPTATRPNRSTSFTHSIHSVTSQTSSAGTPSTIGAPSISLQILDNTDSKLNENADIAKCRMGLDRIRGDIQFRKDWAVTQIQGSGESTNTNQLFATFLRRLKPFEQQVERVEKIIQFLEELANTREANKDQAIKDYLAKKFKPNTPYVSEAPGSRDSFSGVCIYSSDAIPDYKGPREAIIMVDGSMKPPIDVVTFDEESLKSLGEDTVKLLGYYRVKASKLPGQPPKVNLEFRGHKNDKGNMMERKTKNLLGALKPSGGRKL